MHTPSVARAMSFISLVATFFGIISTNRHTQTSEFVLAIVLALFSVSYAILSLAEKKK